MEKNRKFLKSKGPNHQHFLPCNWNQCDVSRCCHLPVHNHCLFACFSLREQDIIAMQVVVHNSEGVIEVWETTQQFDENLNNELINNIWQPPTTLKQLAQTIYSLLLAHNIALHHSLPLHIGENQLIELVHSLAPYSNGVANQLPFTNSVQVTLKLFYFIANLVNLFNSNGWTSEQHVLVFRRIVNWAVHYVLFC